MPKMYHSSDKTVLTEPDKLNDFVKSAVLGQLPIYWETTLVPKEKYSQKIVGEDFEKIIFETQKDTLLFINHPTQEKNRKLLDFYEEFARVEKSKKENKNILFARFNGLNESATFKNPSKLPALIYFKRLNAKDNKEANN